MKTSQSIVVILIIIILGVFILAWAKNNNQFKNTIPTSEQTSFINGCYVAEISKDIYTLNIQSVEGENVSGTLAFQNFEKDSSSGTFKGTYKNGILLGDYVFQSEGMISTMQVIFKKTDNGFMRGYGDLNREGNRFSNLNNIKYEPSPLSIFNKRPCPTNSNTENQVTLSGSYICLPHIDTGGPQTLECALGIKTDNGLYYALSFNLMSQPMPNLKTGDRISARGVIIPIEVLSTNQWQKYPIVGIFSVTDSLRKL